MKKEYMECYMKIVNNIKEIKTNNVKEEINKVFDIQDNLAILNDASSMFDLEDELDITKEVVNDLSKILYSLNEQISSPEDIVRFVETCCILNKMDKIQTELAIINKCLENPTLYKIGEIKAESISTGEESETVV